MTLTAVALLGHDLAAEPHFVDESAFLAQAYFADHLIEGRRDDPDWLTYPAIDLPPLPKYLIGGALRAAGLPRLGPEAARAWYRDTSSRPESAAALVAGRWPSVACGALGTLAILAVGTQVGGLRLGVLAAGLLLANPLYRTHARRAMADAPAEALVLAAAAVGLAAWRRTIAGRLGAGTWLAWIACGVACGLAVLAKLNGGLGTMVVAAWILLGLALPGMPGSRRLALIGGGLVVGVVAFLTFLTLNPTLTARPPRAPAVPMADDALRDASIWGRTAAILRHRAAVSATASGLFPHNALGSPGEKVAAVAVQGFGRFGPFGPRSTDSTIRFDRRQDAGAWVWGPLVVLGLLSAIRLGASQRRAGVPPTGWALATMAGVALATVTAFIPLAWDRYFLSIQPAAALLGALAILDLAGRLGRLLPGGAS